MPSSLSRRNSLRQWGVFIGVILVLPFTVTYFHLYGVLQEEQCQVLASTYQPTMVCRGNRHLQLSSPYPPSIAVLASRIHDLRNGNGGIPAARTGDETILVDYSVPLLERFLPFAYSSSTTTVEESSAVNKYGFRSNKQRSNPLSSIVNPFLFPVATYFFLALNIGLFLLCKLKSVSVATVALNGQLLSKGDLGRAITGNLAHFEPWHLFFNMMTAQSIGSDLLEGRLGTIPLFLYTISWIPITTGVVVMLYSVFHRWRNPANNNSTTVASVMPNMVGFSGILFVWMVLATLQSSNQQSCPIFFFPSLCFETFSVLGMFSVNLGPIVQLIFLQVILPRASFAGHLAGLLVGFVWHWLLQWNRNSTFLLEWTQPCILYPIVWGMGKYMTTSTRWFGNDRSNDEGALVSAGQTLGGGGTGRSRLLWTLDDNQLDDDDNQGNKNDDTVATNDNASTSAPIFRCLTMLRNGMALHTGVLLFAFGTSFVNSMVLSQCMLLAILTALLKESGKGSFGMLGRGYVVMVLITAVSDSMALAGWSVTSAMWQQRWLVILLLWVIRIAGVLGLSLPLICQMLDEEDQMQQQPPSVWYHTLQWWILQPCKSFGKLIIQQAGINSASNAEATLGSGSGNATPARSARESGQARRTRIVSDVV